MLYFIGLGLGDEKDITVKGLETVKKADVLYLESYTSALQCSIKDLEEYYGKKIIKADRTLVEQKAEETILKDAKEKVVVFLVIGDPMAATTHVDLMMRAKKEDIKVKVVNNASVLTAIGITGLELYKFGKITSIPFLNDQITSPIEVYENNKKLGLHTLFLLDLDPINDKFMDVKQAAEFLIKNGIDKDLMVVACASLGSDEPLVRYCRLSEMKDLGKYLQCLIIPGKLHFMETEVLESYK